MKSIRLVIAVGACFIGAGVLLWRSYVQSLPRREQLEKIDAAVSETGMGHRNSRRSNATFPVLRLNGRSETFKYLDWFPKLEVISSEIKAGDQVTILSDTERNLWIWEVQKDGRTIVSYDEILAAVRDNNRFDPLLGFLLAGAGVFGIYRLMKLRTVSAR